MGMLNRLHAVWGTLKGKALVVAMCSLMVLPLITVDAFAVADEGVEDQSASLTMITDEGASTSTANPSEEPIADDEVPLSAFDPLSCWVHYYIIFGIILTILYGGDVIRRRLQYSRKITDYEQNVSGMSKGRNFLHEPVRQSEKTSPSA